MQAVLYIGHGSRVKAGREQSISFIEKCMETIRVPIQEICFLELAEPAIEEGVRRCVQQGATRIAVLPVLLLSAGHAKKDIPEKLAEVKKRYPQIVFRYGRPFGVHEQIVDILSERICEKQQPVAGYASVLLVGRGSSDPDVKRDLQQIARLLSRKNSFDEVNIAFLTAAQPTFEKGLANALESNHRQLFVVPYLLFTGILMRDMEQEIGDLNASDGRLILCESLGYHPNLRDVVRTRVEEIIKETGENSDELPINV